jgi:hypothetical protein
LIRAELDESGYPTGKTVSHEEMAKLNITREAFHVSAWGLIWGN